MTALAEKLDTVPDPFATVRALNRMRAAGFAVSVEVDGLVVRPASGLSDSQRAYLRSHKAAMLALLSDAETVYRALVEAGTAGLAWREGTPADWDDGRLLAAGEVLYADGRMVNRLGRRYATASAPPMPRFHDAPPAPETEPADEVSL